MTAPTMAADETRQYVAPPRVRRQRRPASPLGWYALGAALVGIGLLALASRAWGLNVEPAHYFGVAFAALGAALLIGSVWGHARFLIVIGVLLLPFAWAASLVDVPTDGPWGSLRYSPTTASELREEYRLAVGDLFLDLTGVDDFGDEPITVDASVAVGELRVLVPEGATVELEGSVGAGAMWLLDSPRVDGTRLQDRQTLEGGNPHFILDLEAGLGAIRVDAIQTEDR